MKPKPAPQVVIDTREQRPWSFPADVATTRAGLPAGDYSVVGLEEVLAVERKSLPDFVSSVTHERERFWRELELLAAYHRAAVIVEADASAILAGAYRSKAHPRSVWASVLAITADFRDPRAPRRRRDDRRGVLSLAPPPVVLLPRSRAPSPRARGHLPAIR